ncbi:MAG: isoprenylcysteine carboxylmethyltransferase family protein [Saprospiraceae bacterium]
MHGVDYGGYAYGFWTTVLFVFLIFMFIVFSYVRPKEKFEWRSMGVFIGFLAALFTEMYGFPLTIYLLTSWLGSNYPVLDPFSHASGHLVLVFLGLSHSTAAMSILHILTNGIIFLGIYVIYLGWKKIYHAGPDQLVTDGIYAHIRHPQYVGMMLITIGFLIQWPTVITLAMWPVLLFLYYRLAKYEERKLAVRFGPEFHHYRATVPAIFPRFGKNKIGRTA